MNELVEHSFLYFQLTKENGKVWNPSENKVSLHRTSSFRIKQWLWLLQTCNMVGLCGVSVAHLEVGMKAYICICRMITTFEA